MGIDKRLELVAQFGDNQPTGVAVSSQNRIFINFPRWSPSLSVPSVVELILNPNWKPIPSTQSGLLLTPEKEMEAFKDKYIMKSYPDERWNSWKDSESPKDKFVCVQSVFIDHKDNLWILDPGAPYFGQVVPGGPKLLKVNLTTNLVEQVIHFNQHIAPLTSYLNDVRVDADVTHAYITDSNLGHLVVVDLKTHSQRVVLDNHFSAKAEPNVVPTVEGIEIRLEDGNVFTVHSDGVAVVNDYCYYHSVTGRTMYRIHTKYLNDPTWSEDEIMARVERVGDTGIPDGLVAHVLDNEKLSGKLYTTNLERNGIDLVDEKTGKVTDVVRDDDRLQWPDSISISNGYVYATASQVHLMPIFNKGVNKRSKPYALFRAKL